MSSKGKPFARDRKKETLGDEKNESQSTISAHILKNARQTGQLNLSSRGLTSVPDKVWRVNVDASTEVRDVSLESTERWWDQMELNKLILASNQLSSLSDEIHLLKSLVTLDVHDNNLTSLPSALGDLLHLQKLSASHNKLTLLPDTLIQCQSLKILHVQHNALVKLPEGCDTLVHLEDLDASHNALTGIPESLGHLTSLLKLNLSYNGLVELPCSLQYLKDLIFLDVSHNKLSRLPDDIGFLRSLEQLYARQNKITAAPSLKFCHKIKELHLGDNEVENLGGESLSYLTSLNVLDIGDNRINSLPGEICQLVNLERLDISNNDISGLPYEMGNMTKLKSIVLTGNPMRTMRRDIIARGTEGIKKYLQSRIEQPIPDGQAPAVGVQTNKGMSGVFGGGDMVDAHSVKATKCLDYSGHRAETLPSDVLSLAVENSVTSINLSKNQLREVPHGLYKHADCVASLDLSFNRITSLHPDLGLFLNLCDLDLRNNGLTSLPCEMNSMQRLHTLNLSFNRFTDVPSVVFSLASLENLLMSDNQVATVDAFALLKLQKISSLDLQNNNLGSVPSELGLCQSLRSLLLIGNPFKNPRAAILAKGTPALLEYLRGRIMQ